MLDAFLDWLAGVPGPLVYAILIVLSALENVFPPVPADVAVALGAFLSQRGVTSALGIGVLCWAANTSSAAGMYYLARTHADFFRRGWPRHLLTPEAMSALENAYRRWGVAGIFVSRFLPGVRAAVTPFAGIAGLSPLRALVPTAAASAIWYALLVAAGTMAAREWVRVRHLVEKGTGALGILGLVLTAVVIVWLWRHARRVRQARGL
jgi:membrane protein DedA with SNARE-associated domain